MAELRCNRCGEPLPAPKPLGRGLLAFAICQVCSCLVTRELGEMAGPDERADPDEWGHAWQ